MRCLATLVAGCWRPLLRRAKNTNKFSYRLEAGNLTVFFHAHRAIKPNFQQTPEDTTFNCSLDRPRVKLKPGRMAYPSTACRRQGGGLAVGSFERQGAAALCMEHVFLQSGSFLRRCGKLYSIFCHSYSHFLRGARTVPTGDCRLALAT